MAAGLRPPYGGPTVRTGLTRGPSPTLTHEVSLEKRLGAEEPLLAEGDLLAVGQLAFLRAGRRVSLYFLLVEVQSHVAVLFFYAPDVLPVTYGGEEKGRTEKGVTRDSSQRRPVPREHLPEASAPRGGDGAGTGRQNCSTCSCFRLRSQSLLIRKVSEGLGSRERTVQRGVPS